MSIEVVQQTKSEIKSEMFNRIDFIKKFNMIVLALEKTKLRFNIHEFVNEKEN
jgi:DNA-dependent RNA polymerase auxiliary subunit epsilon